MSAGGACVAVVSGLTLNTDLYLSGPNADLQFDDGSTVTAGKLVQNATIHLQSAYSVLFNNTGPNALLNDYPSQTVTFGRNIIISGESFSNGVFGPFDNRGTIEQNTGGGLLLFEVTNDGSVQAGQSSSLEFASEATVSEGGLGFFFFAGQPWSNNGTMTAAQGGGLGLSGQWTNDGTMTAAQGGGLGLFGQWTNVGTMTVAQGGGLGLSGQWTNDGTITATQVDQVILGGQWTNDGTITVNAVDSLTLGDNSPDVPSDTWKNTGVVSITAAPGASLWLGGYITTDEFESGSWSSGLNLDLSQFTEYLTGTMDNSPADNPITGGILTLNASTGPLYLQGQIDGGTITGTAPISAYGATLNGVIVDVAVDDVQGNLTLEGNWSTTVNAPITATYGTINLSGTWTNNAPITVTAYYGTINLSGTWTNNAPITAP